MARTPQGWKLVRKPSGTYHVRFTHERRRYDISTRESSLGPAQKAAALIYAEVVSGRLKRARSGALVKASTELMVIGSDWIEATLKEYAPGSEKIREVYVRHWAASMPTIGEVTTARIGDYQRARLGAVLKRTLRKELSSLGRFLSWCVEQGVIREVPEFPKMPRKALGTPVEGARKRPTKVLEPEAVELILAAANHDPFLVAAWETALRPQSTIAKLRRSDLSPFGLLIRPECSKNGTNRTIPVSPRARAALEAGLPFGAGDRNAMFKAAATRVLGAGHGFTLYDLKHGRLTKWVDEGKPLGGISWVADVSIKTLVATYVHASRKAAEQVVWCTDGAREQNMQETSTEKTVSGSQSVYARGRDASDSPVNSSRVATDRATKPGVVVPLHQNPALPAIVRIALYRRAVS